MAKDKSKDFQERRSGKERRHYEYALHIPERRRKKDRRMGDRRKDHKLALSKSSTLKKGNQKMAKILKD